MMRIPIISRMAEASINANDANTIVMMKGTITADGVSSGRDDGTMRGDDGTTRGVDDRNEESENKGVTELVDDLLVESLLTLRVMVAFRSVPGKAHVYVWLSSMGLRIVSVLMELLVTSPLVLIALILPDNISMLYFWSLVVASVNHCMTGLKYPVISQLTLTPSLTKVGEEEVRLAVSV